MASLVKLRAEADQKWDIAVTGWVNGQWRLWMDHGGDKGFTKEDECRIGRAGKQM